MPQSVPGIRDALDRLRALSDSTRLVLLPGAVLIAGYPVLSVGLGPDHAPQAFATAFMAALALRIALSLDGVMMRLMRRYSLPQALLIAVLFVAFPMVVLALADDPLWCQRMQSLFYLAFGGAFLVDMLKGRVATATSLWPDPSMRDHLPGLTRMMVIYNLAFLLLNETLIQTLTASTWILFWAMLPVLAHSVLRALVLAVINLNDGQA